jgi:hypothetical protein
MAHIERIRQPFRFPPHTGPRPEQRGQEMGPGPTLERVFNERRIEGHTSTTRLPSMVVERQHQRSGQALLSGFCKDM